MRALLKQAWCSRWLGGRLEICGAVAIGTDLSIYVSAPQPRAGGGIWPNLPGRPGPSALRSDKQSQPRLPPLLAALSPPEHQRSNLAPEAGT